MTSHSSQNENTLFCFGYGYTADYLGHELCDDGGWDIGGTTRSQDKREDLETRKINGFIFDFKRPLPDAKNTLSNVTHILISTPPDDMGDPCFNLHAHHIAQMPNLKWLGYLSTTSVYGNRDGAWVDENDRPRPSNQRGSRRLIAEEQWLSLYEDYDVPVHIFRLAGIYGPGRSALDSVRAGIARRIDKPGQKFNRIHVEDIVQVLKASINKPNAGSIYNVADDTPAPSHEIISHACNLLGRPAPPMVAYEYANLPPMARSFYKDSKLVKNQRIKSELGVELKYADYKEGLKACLDAESYAVSLFKGIGKA